MFSNIFQCFDTNLKRLFHFRRNLLTLCEGTNLVVKQINKVTSLLPRRRFISLSLPLSMPHCSIWSCLSAAGWLARCRPSGWRPDSAEPCCRWPWSATGWTAGGSLFSSAGCAVAVGSLECIGGVCSPGCCAGWLGSCGTTRRKRTNLVYSAVAEQSKHFFFK